jgi:hypothetical protein
MLQNRIEGTARGHDAMRGKMARCHMMQERAGIVNFRSEMKQNSVTQLSPADATVQSIQKELGSIEKTGS